MKTEKPKKPTQPALQTPTSAEIKRDWELAIANLKYRQVKVNGHLLWPGNLMNAFVLEFLDLSEADRVKRANKLFDKYGDKIDFSAESDPDGSARGDISGELKGMGATEKIKPRKADSADAPVGIVGARAVN